MVLMSQAERSGSLRWLKPSSTRLATCPGSGAVSQFSTGANSQARGLSVPPARQYFSYWTASRQTVPAAPAIRPATAAASGVIGFLRTRMAALPPSSVVLAVSPHARPERRPCVISMIASAAPRAHPWTHWPAPWFLHPRRYQRVHGRDEAPGPGLWKRAQTLI